MLLSTDHKFIFVHIPKTAGSALHNALLPYATLPRRTLLSSALRRLPLVEDATTAHFRIHDTAKKIRAKLSSEVWQQYYSFAVVRNPFDHAISHYEYMKQYRSHKIAEKFSQLSFGKYLEYRMSPKGIFDRNFAHLPNQSYFVTVQEKIIVDKVFKYENLNAGIQEIARTLGITLAAPDRLNITKARKKDISDYFNDCDEAADMIREIYRPDFELFKYDNAKLPTPHNLKDAAQ